MGPTSMRYYSTGRLLALACGLAGLGLAGCRTSSSPSSGDPQTAQLFLEVTNVPTDVSCIEVTVTGATTETQLFDVTPGQSGTITVGGLPSGAVTVNELAFPVPCAQVTSSTLASWVAQQPVMTQLVPGQTTDISIVLRRAGQLSISNDFADGASGLAISPASQNFGNVAVGVVGSTPFTLANNGTTAIPFSATISGPNAGQFSVVAGSSCAMLGTLAPGAACTFSVQFAPTATGTMSASLNVSPPGGVTVALSGTGVASSIGLTVSPTSQNFGSVTVGGPIGFQNIILQNTGTSSVAFSTSLTGSNANQFNIQLVGGTCTTLNPLPAGAQCFFTLQFIPTVAGMASATLNVTTANGTLTVPALGVGVAAAPSVAISPAMQNFGSVVVGQTTSTTFNVVNSGTGSTPFSLGVTGANASQFSLTGGTCGPLATLAAGASCTAIVQFAPTTTGTLTAGLSFGGGTATAALTGTGVAGAPAVAISPAMESFGNVKVGQNATATLTITNSGTASTPFSTGIGGTNAAAFTRTGGSCAPLATLAAGASCTLTVQFAPTTLGTATATLSFGSPTLASAALTGVGVTPLTASPAMVSFGNLNVGQNTSNSVTITNGGTTGVVFTSAVTGTNAAEFTRTGGSCASVATLNAGASCSFTLRFAPTATGARSASLTVGSPVLLTVPLTGTGL